MTTVSVQLCDRNHKAIINNLYPLYLYDLAEIREVLPNRYGVFEDEDQYETLAQQVPLFDIWWEKEDVLFPYLISVNDRPAGFALIATPPYVEEGIDFLVNEFFVIRPFRGKGVGAYAAAEIFNQFRGNWMLYTTPTERNSQTITFWRKTLERYTGNQFVEEAKELSHVGLCKTFCFTNKH